MKLRNSAQKITLHAFFCMLFLTSMATKTTCCTVVCPVSSFAGQEEKSGAFQCNIINKEMNIVMTIDFYNANITIPQQEILGETAGFLKYTNDSRCWIITSAEISKNGNEALLEITNDYCSEDLTASLTYNPKDSTYTLKQIQGSTIKIAKGGKWVKLPKELKFEIKH